MIEKEGNSSVDLIRQFDETHRRRHQTNNNYVRLSICAIKAVVANVPCSCALLQLLA